jgi:hypothetical protein
VAAKSWASSLSLISSPQQKSQLVPRNAQTGTASRTPLVTSVHLCSSSRPTTQLQPLPPPSSPLTATTPVTIACAALLSINPRLLRQVLQVVKTPPTLSFFAPLSARRRTQTTTPSPPPPSNPVETICHPLTSTLPPSHTFTPSPCSVPQRALLNPS